MPEQQGERRPVSVLFADIVSSTAIAVRRYDGTVGRLMGDAILAFFGAPVAHEDDPERAVRAAFEMIGAVDALALGADDMRLQLRVGINTGPVLVGMVGTDVASEYTAMGDAVNVASRMPALASPGHIAVTADTHRFVAPLVDARDLGVVQVKGKAEGLHAYELTSLKDSPGRIRGVPGLESPLVGRDAQVAQLLRSSWPTMPGPRPGSSACARSWDRRAPDGRSYRPGKRRSGSAQCSPMPRRPATSG